jgi:predicted metal-dependent peptidase
MSDKEFDLNIHTARLLLDEPFFAAISRRIDKRASSAIPTAGVMVNPDTAQFEMLYNPKFFADLTDLNRTDVLKHEFYHILFEHVTGRMPENVNMETAEGRHNMKLWNIATDLAINSHLSNLPEGGLIPGEDKFKDLPKGQSAEWYLANMPDFEEEDQGQKGDGADQEGEGGQGGEQGNNSGNGDGVPDSLDDHSGWAQCSNEVKEMAKERLKETVRKAAEEASKSNGWGSVSNSVRKDVMKMLETKVDWRKVLRFFVKSSQRADRSSSIKRINRRYAYVHPGRKANRVAKLAVSIDQSGSVSDEMLSLFFAELNKLSSVAEFVVIPFDTQVDEDLVYTWKKNKHQKPERVMSGGTDFNAPTDYVNKGGFDGHIVLTDMCAPKPRPSKCQRMWMTTPEYAKVNYFATKERVVIVE